MKVNQINNNYQKNSLNFGMAVKVSPNMAEYLKKNLTPREAKKFAAIVERQKTNPIDISVYLSERTERFFSPIQYGKLCEKVHENVFSADVANRTIYGNECFTLFKNPIIKLMEKAEKLANKQTKTNSYIDNCLKV